MQKMNQLNGNNENDIIEKSFEEIVKQLNINQGNYSKEEIVKFKSKTIL